MQTQNELMATVRENPEDTRAWEVLTDWLLSVDDPRGTLAAADKDEALVARLLEELVPQWVGQPARATGRVATVRKKPDDTQGPGLTFTFERGHVRRLKVDTEWDGDRDGWDQDFLHPILQKLLAHPVGQLIQEMEVRATPNSEFFYEGLMESITGTPPLCVRTIYVGDNDQLSWTNVPDCSTLWAAAPWLLDAKLQGSNIRLGQIDHERLQKLHLISGGLPKEPVAALASGKLPALRDLEVWFGSSGYGAECSIDDVVPLMGRSFPSLVRMGLCNCEFGDEVARSVPKAPWLPQIKELSLYGSVLTDRGGEALLAHRDALVHLTRLDLSRCYLSPAVAGRLTAAFGSALFLGEGYKGQQTADEWDGEPHYYVAVGE